MYDSGLDFGQENILFSFSMKNINEVSDKIWLWS